MTNYRRVKIEGGTFFFTVVTHQRQSFLCQPDNIALLREAFRNVMTRHPFKIDAFVLLPDHLHCIWTLPPDDFDFSKRWRLIKTYFSRRCENQYSGSISASRERKREKGVWQRRFWEHSIRNDGDFNRHVDYIHYNPVKHGLVTAPKDWPHSSFHRYIREGLIELDWGAGKNITFDDAVGNE